MQQPAVPNSTYKPQFPQVAELATMSAQEVFDRAAVHLLKQGRKTYDDRLVPSCLYRGAADTCCGVGVLIPQEVYADRLEGLPLRLLARGEDRRPDPVLVLFAQKFESLLEEIQGIHDLRDPETWRENLARLACQLKLSTAAMDAVPEVAA